MKEIIFEYGELQVKFYLLSDFTLLGSSSEYIFKGVVIYKDSIDEISDINIEVIRNFPTQKERLKYYEDFIENKLGILGEIVKNLTFLFQMWSKYFSMRTMNE